MLEPLGEVVVHLSEGFATGWRDGIAVVGVWTSACRGWWWLFLLGGEGAGWCCAVLLAAGEAELLSETAPVETADSEGEDEAEGACGEEVGVLDNVEEHVGHFERGLNVGCSQVCMRLTEL